MHSAEPNRPWFYITVGVQCHVGKKRSENQDRVSRAATPFGDLFIVADGVGGYRGGAEAAQATVDGFIRYLKAHGELTLQDAMQQAARAVSVSLQQRSSGIQNTHGQERHGMGSTVVLCVVHGNRATYAHVGDSRAYLVRGHELIQLTRDHSLMERLIAGGTVSASQALSSPEASVLTRAIGQSAEVEVEIGELDLEAEDSLLLCSDGLWAYADAAEMQAIAASENLSASAVATALLRLALEGGGGDNISIQFIRMQKAHTQGKRWLLGKTAKDVVFILVAALLVILAVRLAIWNQQHSLNPPTDGSPPAVSAPRP